LHRIIGNCRRFIIDDLSAHSYFSGNGIYHFNIHSNCYVSANIRCPSPQPSSKGTTSWLITFFGYVTTLSITKDWSLCLCGVRDYESLTLRSFTSQEAGELYAQHTAETGQVFLGGRPGRGAAHHRGARRGRKGCADPGAGHAPGLAGGEAARGAGAPGHQADPDRRHAADGRHERRPALRAGPGAHHGPAARADRQPPVPGDHPPHPVLRDAGVAGAGGGVVPAARRDAGHGAAAGGVPGVLRRARRGVAAALRLPGGGAAPLADGLSAAGGERRRADHAGVRGGLRPRGPGGGVQRGAPPWICQR
jgi:hypothetical protein